MEKYVKSFTTQLQNMKSGKISPSQIENIKITLTSSEVHSVKALANVVVKSPKLIVLTVYDKSNLNPICNKIRDEDLGVNPIIEGININIPVPPITMEIRETAVKQAKKHAETTKENIRNVRHQGQNKLKDLKKENIKGWLISKRTRASKGHRWVCETNRWPSG